MNPILEKIHTIGILPVVVLHDEKDAVALAAALIEGGIPCAEVTFRTAGAANAISLMRKAYPQMLVGAGTILTVVQAQTAIDAGAQFVISPGFDEEIVAYCIKKNIPVIPGIASASEVQKAFRMGLHVVKFFPAEAAGGLPMIKALSAPYTNINFIPTGGINEKNMSRYLSNQNVLAIGGSWMVSDNDIKAKSFDKITTLSKQAVCLRNEVC